MKRIMKHLLTLLCLFVTLGVAQAYSQPEEPIDQVPIEIVYDLGVDALDINVQFTSEMITSVIIDSRTENSRAIETFELRDISAEYLYETIELEQTRSTAQILTSNYCWPIHFNLTADQYQRNYDKDHRTSERLRQSGAELVPPVPWRSLKRSTIHNHFHS